MDLQQVGWQHPRVRQLVGLQHNTAPNRHQLFVAEGLWAHRLLLQHDVPVEVFLWCPEAGYSDEVVKRSHQLVEHARHAYRISPRTMHRLSERDRPDGLISIARLPTWQPDEVGLGERALVLVADGLEIPGNLGTLLRTLDACAADALLLVNRRTRLTHPKVFRGSHGASLVVPTVSFDQPMEAVTWLTDRDFGVFLADTAATTSYRRCRYPSRTAVVVGNERYGISSLWYEAGFERVRVPMLGVGDSLNVAVSASVLLYEARAQLEGW